MNNELEKNLEDHACKNSFSFCYLCYVEAPTGICPMCGSDDLIRYAVGKESEYGIEEDVLQDGAKPTK